MAEGSDDPLSLLENRRKYSAFFELGNKKLKELTVGEELIRALNSEFGYSLERLALHEPDPPDLPCYLGSKRVALEVTELVCGKAVKANETGVQVYCEWSSAMWPKRCTRCCTERIQSSFRVTRFRLSGYACSPTSSR